MRITAAHRTTRILGALAAGAALVLSTLATGAPEAHASTTPGYNGRIAFDAVRADGKKQVYSMKADGTDLKQVTTSTTHDSYAPQYLDGGSKILYTVDNGPGQLFAIAPADGSGEARLQGRLDNESYCLNGIQPTIDRNWTFLVFVCEEQLLVDPYTGAKTYLPEYNLWKMPIRWYDGVPEPGGMSTRLTSGGSNLDREELPSISPDGSSVVFQSYHHDAATGADSDFRIESVPVSGGSRTILAVQPPGGRVYNPEYSPDGTRILFERWATGDAGTSELYLMSRYGTGLTRLTNDSLWQAYPTWSPDGRRIVFTQSNTTCDCATLAMMQATPSDVPHPIGNVATWNSGHWDNFAPHWQSLYDGVPPTTPTVTGNPVFTLGGFTLHYSSSDAGAGVEWYTLHTTRSAWNGTSWTSLGYNATWNDWVHTSATMNAPAAGTTTCYSIAARDRSGNTSPARQVCTARPVDEQTASYSSGWTHVTATSYYGGSANRTTTKGASFSLKTFSGDRVGLLVRACADCGALDVYVNGVKYGTLNTYAATTQYKAWRLLPTFNTTSGTVRFVTTSGKAVFVDAIGLRKY